MMFCFETAWSEHYQTTLGCTREPDHDGDHMATNGQRVLMTWPQKQVEISLTEQEKS